MTRTPHPHRISLLLLALPLLFTSPLRAQKDSPTLLQNLASPDFATRESAQAQLQNIPASQVNVLQNLFANPGLDPEVKARLESRIHQMAIEIVRNPPTVITPPAPHVLTVRIVDPAGKPITGATVGTPAYPYGPQLVHTSDENGRVTFGVPSDSSTFVVSAETSPYFHASQFIRQNPSAPGLPAADIILQRPPVPLNSLRGTVRDERGLPIRHQTLQLFDTYHGCLSTTTDNDGGFSFPDDGHLDRAIPFLRVGDLVTPIDPLRDFKLPIALTLRPAATLTGKVTEQFTGSPVGDAAVVIHAGPNPYSLAFTARTAADGTYKISGVAPGDYHIEIDDPAYIDLPTRTRAGGAGEPFVHVAQNTTANVVVQKSAILIGQVLEPSGQPAAGATIRVRQRGGPAALRTFTANPDGRFYLSTTLFNSKEVYLTSASSTGGYVETPVGPLTPGDFRNLSIQLPGSVRIRGVVADAAGHPIKNVVCSINVPGHWFENENALVVTDDAGAFDFGNVTLSSGEAKTNIRFNAPRPRLANRPDDPAGAQWSGDLLSSPGHIVGQNYYLDVSTRERAPPFFLDAISSFDADVTTGEVNLKPVLAPAHLVELTGIVKDPHDIPAPDAVVFLLTNDAAPDEWLKSVYDMAHVFVLHNHMPEPTFQQVAGAHTDAQGHWTIFTLRELNRNGTRLFAPNNPSSVTLGATTFGGTHSAFISNLPLSTTDEKTNIPLQLTPVVTVYHSPSKAAIVLQKSGLRPIGSTEF